MEIRTTKPINNNFYKTTSWGGYSLCIEGYPRDNSCNVLSNCVGYACGRFNEIIGEMKYPYLNCNAENFIERARSYYGLEIVGYPTLGGIMVFEGEGDLAGHVFIVEEIKDKNTIYTSESNYGGEAFFNVVRNNSNGRWGLSKYYKFIGCIINPAIGDVHYEEVIPTPEPSDEKEALILLLVKRTIRGDFGNGENRRNILVSRYGEDIANEVQRQVNNNVNNNNLNWDTIKLY